MFIRLTHCFVATSDLKLNHIIRNSLSFLQIDVNLFFGAETQIAHKLQVEESMERASFGRPDFDLAATCMVAQEFARV